MTLPSFEFVLPLDFYARYWQREPLVLRDAVANFRSPLSADELAGLACLPEVESRIVLECGGDEPWEVRHGPFKEDTFAQMPGSHWTLLVQAVDHWDTDVAALRRAFRPIPNWRIDDVMVSYAADGGSVGPHFDHYDVFLLQGLGRRRWRLGGPVGPDPTLVPGIDLRLLSDFETHDEHLLEPGDALYLPPGYAHWGIAEGECMTYSIGFRSPSAGELIDGFAAEVAERLPEHQRYQDPPNVAAGSAHPGEITAVAVKRLRDIVVQELSEPALAEWFGAYATMRKYSGDLIEIDLAAAAHSLDQCTSCRARDDSRFAFMRRDGKFDLFVDGHRFICPATAERLLTRLCDGSRLEPADVIEFRDLVLELIRIDCLALKLHGQET